LIRVTTDAAEVRATFEDRRWVFPRADCALLAIPNTTSELLARYIGQRLLADLERSAGTQPPCLRIALDDCLGQTAVVELRGADGTAQE
jgi:6-pyruvoyltetrahydropterin/6-carboxytetrahydropterin synthase